MESEAESRLASLASTASFASRGEARMDRFVPLSASLQTLSAHLHPDERILLHQDGVGLYDGSAHLCCPSLSCCTHPGRSSTGKRNHPSTTMVDCTSRTIA